MIALLATLAAGLCIGDSIQANGGGACNMLPYEMTNVARNGTTTGYWRQNIPALDSHYDFAIITLGTNDAAYPIDPLAVRNNIGYIAGALHQSGIEYILLDIPPRAYGVHASRTPWIDAYAVQYQAIADYAPFVYMGVDWREHMDEACFEDGLHPSAGCNARLVGPYVRRITRTIGLDPVPEPGTGVLLATGLIGLGLMGRERG